MKKKSISIHTFLRKISAMVLIMVVMCMSCSKDDEEMVTPTPPPTPPATPASGVIDYFVVTDTLMPFYTAGATLKWLVSGTNNLTVVRINGVKVPFNGIQDTGPLKQTTTFKLTVNSSKEDSLVVKVADSVTTLLWNKGNKRLKIIRKQYGVYQIGSATASAYKDTTIDAYVADQRIYFNYNNLSEIIQQSSSTNVSLADGGRFTISRSHDYLSWQGKLFFINLLDANFLQLEFDEIQSTGVKFKIRHTYQYE